MSVRAYRIIKVERESNPTFNLWHDEKFMDFMQYNSENDIFSMLSEGGGQIEFEVGILKKALKEFDFGDDTHMKEQVKKDIDFATKVGDDYILYDCF